MNPSKEPQKKQQDVPQKPEPVRLSDPGPTPGSAEGERGPIEEALRERQRNEPPKKN